MSSKRIGQILTLWHYLGYLQKARHRKGHGIQSPFVYELVSKVIHDKTWHNEYEFFKRIRKRLNHSDAILDIKDDGAGSKYFKNNNRPVSALARVSSVTPKFGKLLFRLARFYKPATIVELGTSIGLSTIYLAMGNTASEVISIEEDFILCEFAKQVFHENDLKNITVLHGRFDDKLGEISEQINDPTLVFIDGNHRYGAAIRYFDYFCEKVKSGTIIFDDIHWSQEMRKAWKTVAKDARTHVSIDLFFMGMVIRRPDTTPGNYTVKF